MPMSEKDMFLNNLDREVQTTVKLLKNYPNEKLDFKPHEKSRSARDLAWIFASEMGIMGMAIDGKIDFSQPSPKAPSSMNEIIAGLEKSVKTISERVRKMSDADFNSSIKFPVGPGKMGEFRKADVLWFVSTDHVHHRGQFSVYLRMAGGKVPSIYGPSADEPWM